MPSSQSGKRDPKLNFCHMEMLPAFNCSLHAVDLQIHISKFDHNSEVQLTHWASDWSSSHTHHISNYSHHHIHILTSQYLSRIFFFIDGRILCVKWSHWMPLIFTIVIKNVVSYNGYFVLGSVHIKPCLWKTPYLPLSVTIILGRVANWNTLVFRSNHMTQSR